MFKKNDIKLKFQRLYFYYEFQYVMNQTNMNIESTYSINNALVFKSKNNMLSQHAWIYKK